MADSREKRVTSSKQITHTLPSHKLRLALKINSDSYELLWINLLSFFPFLFLLKWHHCPIKEKLIKAIRVPTVMDNLGNSGNLINFKIICKE